MPTEPAHEPDDYDWQLYQVLVPRLGLVLDRHGVRTRVIWPGQYLVRKSRSLRKWMYRRR